MSRIKSIVLGLALTLPLASVGAGEAVPQTYQAATPPQVDAGPSGQEQCCWVYYFGSWYCIYYC